MPVIRDGNRDKVDIPWASIRQEYENRDCSLDSLAIKYQVDYQKIYRRSKKERWLKFSKSVDDCNDMVLLDLKQLKKDLRVEVCKVAKQLNDDPNCNVASLSEQMQTRERVSVVHKTELQAMHIIFGKAIDALNKYVVSQDNVKDFLLCTKMATEGLQRIQDSERKSYRMDEPVAIKDDKGKIQEVIDIIQNSGDGKDLLPKFDEMDDSMFDE